jgi:hypothetical protein
MLFRCIVDCASGKSGRSGILRGYHKAGGAMKCRGLDSVLHLVAPECKVARAKAVPRYIRERGLVWEGGLPSQIIPPTPLGAREGARTPRDSSADLSSKRTNAQTLFCGCGMFF